MAGNPIGEGPQYWAFISYSHGDAVFGRRLHRRLESYSLPRRLVGRTTGQGTVPRRLVPIFRDRDEFSAANDLTAEVRAALQASGSLVVVCSRDAAMSKWVSREVELFRALHPDRPVLAAIRYGEPAECFPESLLRAGPGGGLIEPLAADFRSGRDGRHLGLLKVVAGIVGLGLDELVQRDAQRNLLRVTAVTGAAVTAALLMGALTAFAFNARAEAERQRGEAEGLVEFMLTDLRDTLKGVGRLDVMTAVNQRALRYYADQDLGALPVDSLERRARILHAMGEDDEERADLDAALKKFLEAKRTTAALLADAPNDPERIFDHAQSEYWVALIDWRRFHVDAAQAGFERYALLADRLIAINPANHDWQMEAGYAESNLGTLKLNARDNPAQAQLHFMRALEHFQIALRARPEDSDVLSQIADGYAWLADSQFELRHYDQARANRVLETRLLNYLLAKDPKNAEYARSLLGNALGFGRLDLAQGRIKDADRRLTAALADAARQGAADHDDKNRTRERILIGLYLARAKLAQNPVPLNAVKNLLSPCNEPVAWSDREIQDFCALASAMTGAAEGRPNPAAWNYLCLNRIRLADTHRSPRWGIDLSQELSFASRTAEGEKNVHHDACTESDNSR